MALEIADLLLAAVEAVLLFRGSSLRLLQCLTRQTYRLLQALFKRGRIQLWRKCLPLLLQLGQISPCRIQCQPLLHALLLGPLLLEGLLQPVDVGQPIAQLAPLLTGSLMCLLDLILGWTSIQSQ